MTNYEKFTHILKFFKLRDPLAYEHFYRVRQIATIIANNLGIKDAKKIRTIKEAAFLHDVGKIFIPDKILLKEKSLDFEEYEIVKEHVEIGAEIISAFLKEPEVSKIVAQHHEAYDGSGYPLGLTGKEICIGAKICAIADSFDTIYSGRTYRVARHFHHAVKEINDCSGTLYDPKVVEAFNKCCDRINTEIYTRFKT